MLKERRFSENESKRQKEKTKEREGERVLRALKLPATQVQKGEKREKQKESELRFKK